MTQFYFETRGTRYPATYQVCGRFIVVVSAFGTHRAVIGLADPHKLARAVLRSIVQKQAGNDVAEPAAASPAISPANIMRTSVARPKVAAPFPPPTLEASR